MPPAMYNMNPPIPYMAYKAAFFVNAAAVLPLQITGKRFRFPNTLHTDIPHKGSLRLSDPRGNKLPAFIVFPEMAKITSFQEYVPDITIL